MGFLFESRTEIAGFLEYLKTIKKIFGDFLTFSVNAVLRRCTGQQNVLQLVSESSTEKVSLRVPREPFYNGYGDWTC